MQSGLVLAAVAANVLPPMFSGLEPLAGAVLAVSLAYLALPSLRYRDRVSQIARDALGSIEGVRNSSKYTSNAYRRLIQFADKLASEEQKGHLEKHPMPPGENLGPYHWFFGVGQVTVKVPRDTKVAALSAILGFVTIVLGVVETSDSFGLAKFIAWLPGWFSEVSLILLALGIIPPLAFIWAGRERVAWAQQIIDHLEAECQKEMIAQGITAAIPDRAPYPLLGALEKETIAAMAVQIRKELDSAEDEPKKKPSKKEDG